MINKETDSNEKKHHLKIDGNINLHTHSIFCDGKNTLEELIQSAIKKGFSVLGFSSHSIYPFAETWHICPKYNRHHRYKMVFRIHHKYELIFVTALDNLFRQIELSLKIASLLSFLS